MRNYLQRTSKPPIGTPLDLSHDLVRGLIAFYPLWEGGGSSCSDVVNGLKATITGAVWEPGATSVRLNCNASGHYALATLPAALQYPTPLSIAVGFRYQTSVSGSGIEPNIFGIGFNNPETSPDYVLNLTQVTGSLEWATNNGGAPVGSAALSTLTVGSDYVASVSLRNGTQNVYLNGVNVSNTTTAVTDAKGYSATSCLKLGEVSKSSGCSLYWAAVWRGMLTAGQHLAVTRSLDSIWQIFQPVTTLSPFIFAPRLTNPILRPRADYTGSSRKVWAD